ncbi:hypothetical protein SAMD00019534_014900 [Acytostelium subglobosum LB1]|uniref:hypothetical protein n=1 Tax=Acytostelium subglobosum LB1 TaxID=1410327 RepID=UPI000644A77F|nr:hypothetical protein SAMD00019534_014900 [Acytostelium subglobosum LB1]GAM18315.1 hypothetical protein SAMD00019534_014900 [Acytostelium subglobosum LB1]|eukprot:XP_012757535.1 hypothetical protein SAMD00019534_014900 [Acytostelium subglobosum LB1]
MNNYYVYKNIIQHLWRDRHTTLKWKLQLALVSKNFFRVISECHFTSLSLQSPRDYFSGFDPSILDRALQHIQSPYCLLKRTSYLSFYTSLYKQCAERLSPLIQSAETLWLVGSEIPTLSQLLLENFAKVQLQPALRAIKISAIETDELDKLTQTIFGADSPLAHVILCSLLITCNITYIDPEFQQINNDSHGISFANRFLQLTELTLCGFGSFGGILSDRPIVTRLTTLVLGSDWTHFNSCGRNYFKIADPVAFFALLSENQVLQRLDLFLYNQTDNNDYKPSFFNYLAGNQSLTSLSLGFIRDRNYLQLIGTKHNIRHLQISMNEPIVFEKVRSLKLSSRSDHNVYHQLIAIKDHFLQNPASCCLTSLSLKFSQFWMVTGDTIFTHLT